MYGSVADAYSALIPDPSRQDNPFSEDLLDASKVLIDPATPHAEKAAIMKDWLARHQPCQFGRMAAGSFDLIDFTFLNELDLLLPDTQIESKIQAARLTWKGHALSGRKSAFIVVAASERLLHARPDQALATLSVRLCELLLLRTVKLNVTYRDTVVLQLKKPNTPCRAFGVGVDFFCSAGDRRWWNDHRFPGGIGFSLNSPGHMALNHHQQKEDVDLRHRIAAEYSTRKGKYSEIIKSRLERWAERLEKVRKIDSDHKIDGPPAVLKYAMLTISEASEQLDAARGSIWSKATQLRARDGSLPECPYAEIRATSTLSNKDHCKYDGFYHTDHSIRSSFFDEHMKPAKPFELDFTYLHDPCEQDYVELTTGINIQRPTLDVVEELRTEIFDG